MIWRFIRRVLRAQFLRPAIPRPQTSRMLAFLLSDTLPVPPGRLHEPVPDAAPELRFEMKEIPLLPPSALQIPPSTRVLAAAATIPHSFDPASSRRAQR